MARARHDHKRPKSPPGDVLSTNQLRRLRLLHGIGLRDRDIGQTMRLQPIVVRAQRRRMGLGPNAGDPPFGTYEMNWLALQQALGVGADCVAEQFREYLLRGALRGP